MPACGPRRGSTSSPVRLIFTRKHSRPSRGAKPREVDDARPPQGQPHQASSRGVERSRKGTPREVPMTQAMTTEARRAPGGHQRAQCPRFLFGAKGASAGAECRGIKQRLPYWCNETKTRRTARRRSLWSPRRRHHQSLWQAKTAFVRIACTSCPLRIGRCGIPSRSIFGKRTRAPINRDNHHSRRGDGPKEISPVEISPRTKRN